MKKIILGLILCLGMTAHAQYRKDQLSSMNTRVIKSAGAYSSANMGKFMDSLILSLESQRRAAGYLPIGNTSGIAVDVPLSGDGSLSSSGALSVTKLLGNTIPSNASGALTNNGSGILTWMGGSVTSVSGTSNRITSSGGATPAIDISASYVGQSSITTLGIIGSGTWQGTAIGDTYISSASIWNAKQNAISFGTNIPAWLTTPSSANLAAAMTDETGSGALVFGTAPTITLANGTGLPLATGVTGILPVANGGTNTTTADFQTLTYGSTTTWNQGSIKAPYAKVTATGSFTLALTNLISGSSGVLKMTTNTASAITITFDAGFTHKTLNSTFTTYVFPAVTAKEYYLYFTADGTTLEWNIVSTTGIIDPGGSNDDFLQRKSGAWTNRTIAQVLSDFNFTKVIPYYMASTTAALTNQSSGVQVFPISLLINYPRFSLLGFKSVRLVLGQITTGSASANSPRIYIQYTATLTGSPPVTGWTTFGAGTVASGDAISLASIAYGPVSNWITIPAGALTGDVLLRVLTEGGDGVADPAVTNVYIECSTQ